MRPDPRYPGTRHWEVIERFVKENGWTRGAELGLLKGKCFIYLLETCPKLTLIGVDQWKQLPPSDEEGAEHYRMHDMRRAEQMVRDGARRFGDRAIIIKGDTVETAACMKDDSLDFVWIDAAHTEPATMANIIAWAPKVCQSGMIMGHDWNWPSVRRALDRTLPGWKGLPEHVWVIPKSEYRA